MPYWARSGGGLAGRFKCREQDVISLKPLEKEESKVGWASTGSIPDIPILAHLLSWEIPGYDEPAVTKRHRG